MLTRRIVAFEANISRLLLRKCCLWTFTLKEVVEPREAARRWTTLLKALRRANPEWSGVRVFEMHPGRWGEFSHGLHVHLVSCDFYSDRILNSLVRSYGWGRWDRRPIFEREAAFYIGKYLQKKRPGALRGMRLQSCFGLRDFTRFRDVIIECDRSRAWRQLAAEVRAEGGEWRELKWTAKLRAVSRLLFKVVADGMVWNEEKGHFIAWGPEPSLASNDPDAWIDEALERQRSTPVGPPSSYSQQDLRDQERMGMQGWLIWRERQREHCSVILS